MKYATNHIRSNVTRLVAVAALLTFLACGIGSSVFSAGEKAANLPPELAVVPQDAFLFVYARPAELWESDLAAKLRKLYPQEATVAAKALQQFSLDPADIDSVSLVFATPQAFAIFTDEVAGELFPIFGSPKKFRDVKGKIGDFPDKFPPKKLNDDKDGPSKDKDKEKAPKTDKSEGSRAQDESPKKDFDPPKKFGPKKAVGDFPPRAPFMTIVTWVKPYDQDKIKAMLFGKDAREETHNGKTYFTAPGNEKFALHFLNEKTFLAVSPSWIKTILDQPPALRAQGAQAAALDLAQKKRLLAIGVTMMEPTAQAGMKQAAEQMREPWNSAPLAIYPLLSARSGWLGVDLGKDNRLQVNAALTFADPASAHEALGATKDALILGRIFALGQTAQALRMQMEEAAEPTNLLFLSLLLKQVDTAWRAAVIERRQATIQIQAEATLDVEALKAQAKSAAKSFVKDEAALEMLARKQSRDNIKQIMLALHAYNDANKQLPPARTINPENGKPLLSWRVTILPYLETQFDGEGYDFKQDEPWDSPHNIKLLPRMPKIYAPIRVKTKEPYCTFYQGFSGPGTAFESEAKKVGDRFVATPISIPRSFTDGTSQTIGIIEAGEAVPWTKPEDVPYDAKQPLPRLGGLFNGGFHVGMMDGSVRFIGGVAKEGVGPFDVPKGFVSQETLRAAITRNGGEVLGPDW